MLKILLTLLCALAITATTAHAEHKLLITDVLAAKQFEVEAAFNYGHSSGDTSLKLPSYDANTGLQIGYVEAPGTQTRNIVSSLYSLGIGIGYGLQLNAAIPFVFVDNMKQHNIYDSRIFYDYNWKQDGVGDLAVGVKYSLYEDKARTLSVVTGIDVKFFTADSNKAGTGTNDIAPFIAVSTVINEDLRPYASYQAIFRNNGAADSHVVSVGAEYELNKTITLTPEFSATFNTDSNWTTAYNSYSVGLSSYVNIYSNFYLTPTFSTGISTSSSTKNHYMDYGTLRFVNAGLGLYYLFN